MQTLLRKNLRPTGDYQDNFRWFSLPMYQRAALINQCEAKAGCD